MGKKLNIKFPKIDPSLVVFKVENLPRENINSFVSIPYLHSICLRTYYHTSPHTNYISCQDPVEIFISLKP